MSLRIVLSNTSGAPIYAQIVDQIREAILTGALAEGDALPSIRVLAKDLRVSVITTTRAYSELAAEGFVANVPGKGSYVLPRDSELVRERVLRDVEENLSAAIRQASLIELDREELHNMLDTLIDVPVPQEES